MKDFQFMDTYSCGWVRAWNLIAVKYGGQACYDKASGECWQYLGSVDGVHEFRHRCLPATGKRTYERIPVEPGDFDKAI